MSDERGKIPKNLSGYFLIAETELQDPNFFRTVVLIISHNEEGAFGLVMNRQSEVVLGEIVDTFENSSFRDLPVFVGGPVQQNYLFVVHSGIPDEFTSEHAEVPTRGVVFEPSFQHVADFLDSPIFLSMEPTERPQIRLYAGYSGWGPDQLEEELAEGAWLVHPATADIVFHENPEEGWRDALSSKGSFYRIVAQTGFKPSMN